MRLVGRRADGYHLIDSLFVPIDLADRLTLSSRPLVSSGAAGTPGAPGAPSEVALRLRVAAGRGADDALASDVPSDDTNLAVRAARAFASAAGLALRVEIELEKRIPAGAGLGGGSSDAAAVLRGLAALHSGAVAPEELRQIALGLGADVPFFLSPVPAWVTGIGESIEPAAGVPPLDCVLAKPGVSLATADVYAGYDAARVALTAPGPRPTMPAVFEPRSDGRAADELEMQLRNDLEPAAAALCPGILELRTRLERAGAYAIGMSGSGATMFGIFAGRPGAEAACAELRSERVWAEAVRSSGS